MSAFAVRNGKLIGPDGAYFTDHLADINSRAAADYREDS
jgi:hypothetical protein